MTPITWQAAVDDEEQRPQLQDIFEAAIDGYLLAWLLGR